MVTNWQDVGIDSSWAVPNRIAQAAQNAWLSGGDVFLRNRYTANNIDQYLPDIMARQQAYNDEAAQQWIQLEDGYYYLNGNPYGPSTATPPVRGGPTAGRSSPSLVDRYTSGAYQLNPRDAAYYRRLTGQDNAAGAFADVFSQDVGAALDLLGSESFNPFYGYQYDPAVLSAQIASFEKQATGNPAFQQGLDLALQKQADYNNRLQGGMADYLYDVTSDLSMSPYRKDILNRWNQYTRDNPNARFQQAASQDVFDALGLSDFGLSFDPNAVSTGAPAANQYQGDLMYGAQQSYPVKGGAMPNYGIPAKGGYSSGYRNQFSGKGGMQ